MSDYATKSDLKIVTGAVHTSKSAKKVDLASLKLEIDKLGIDELEKVSSVLIILKSNLDKLDVDKLKPVLVHLKKLNDVVDKEVVKNDVYDDWLKRLMALTPVNLLSQCFFKLGKKWSFENS